MNIAKSILNKSRDPYIALMEYRASPLAGIDKSPAELLFNRNLRTKLPCKAANLESIIPGDSVREKIKLNKSRQKFYYDRSAGSELPDIREGDEIRFKKDDKSDWKPGVVRDKADIRSYNVEDSSGQLYRRNRKFIHKPAEPRRSPRITRPPDRLLY